jgi:hypothetical protein
MSGYGVVDSPVSAMFRNSRRKVVAMSLKYPVLVFLLAVIAVCLVKVSFFPSAAGPRSLIPSAYADGGVIEWKDAMRIVTAGDNGSTTYVWDYEGKTKVRKYSIQKGKLVLEIYNLEN